MSFDARTLAYTPCDPQWEMYGETLRQERMLKNMRYRKEWAKLYADQRGVCAVCGYEMDMDTGWSTATLNIVWMEAPMLSEIVYYSTRPATRTYIALICK